VDQGREEIECWMPILGGDSQDNQATLANARRAVGEKASLSRVYLGGIPLLVPGH
jgi:hypothetical protein